MPISITTAGAENLENVLVISIDALHPDALRQSKSPHLQMLMRDGAFSLNGQSTHPPKTLIAHTAMLTGMSPEENGKVDNDWWPGETTVQKEIELGRVFLGPDPERAGEDALFIIGSESRDQPPVGARLRTN